MSTRSVSTRPRGAARPNRRGAAKRRQVMRRRLLLLAVVALAAVAIPASKSSGTSTTRARGAGRRADSSARHAAIRAPTRGHSSRSSHALYAEDDRVRRQRRGTEPRERRQRL